MLDFTLLSKEEILFNYYNNKQIDILKKIGIKSAVTDFSILLGAEVSSNEFINNENNLKNRIGYWWTRTFEEDDREKELCYNNEDILFRKKMYLLNDDKAYYIGSYARKAMVNIRNIGIRPAIKYSSISQLCKNKKNNEFDILEVEYGEYPQTIVSESFSNILENLYKNKKIKKTGKIYTTDSVNYKNINTNFIPREHIEYEFMGEKYIRFVGDSNCNGKVLSDGRIIKESEVYWVRVEPIKWLVDEKANIALAKKILFSGVQFKHNKYYIGDFNKTIIKQFMDKYFSQEIKLNKSKKVKNKKERKTLINDIIRKHYITKYLKELYFI